jgi:hypothetical protein
MAGKRTEAQKLLQQMNSPAVRNHVGDSEFALIYLGLGDKRRALDWLERARLSHDSDLIYLRADARFEPLRSDLRFQELVHRIYMGALER